MKEKLEADLVALAKTIATLNEYPSLPKNAKLEVKIDAHSVQWRSLLYQAFAKVYEYAKLLEYSPKAYSNFEITGDDKEGEISFSRKEQLLTEAGEEIIKVATRRFTHEELTKGEAYIEENFIKKLTVDLHLSVLNASKTELRNNIHKGITELSEKDERLVNDYNKFKKDFLGYKKNSVTEDVVMELFLKTHLLNEWTKNPQKAKEKLQEKLKMFFQANVIGESYIEKQTNKKYSSLDDYADEQNLSPEEQYLLKEEKQEKLKKFKKTIEATKEFFDEELTRKNTDIDYWKAIVTQYLLEEMQVNSRDTELLNILTNCKFVRKGLINELEKTGSFSSRSEILQQLKKDKGQASKDIKRFKEFLQNKKKISK